MANARKNVPGELRPDADGLEVEQSFFKNIRQPMDGAIPLSSLATKADLQLLNENHREDIRKIDVKIDKVEAGLKEDIEKLDAKIDKVETGLKEDIEKLDVKIDKVETGLKEDIEKLDVKIDKVETNINKKIDKVEAGLKEDINKLDVKIDRVDARMDRVEVKVDALGKGMWRVGAAIVGAFIAIARFFMHP